MTSTSSKQSLSLFPYILYGSSTVRNPTLKQTLGGLCFSHCYVLGVCLLSLSFHLLCTSETALRESI